MGTVVEKLQKALDNKASIKSALLEVGANVTDNMSGYAPEILKFKSAYDIIKMMISGVAVEGVETFEIPTGVSKIRDYAFYNANGFFINGLLENITFDSVGTYAFNGCIFKNGLEINVNENIGTYAFNSCDINGTLKIKCKNIGDRSFYGCFDVENVHIDCEKIDKYGLFFRANSDDFKNVYISNKLNSYNENCICDYNNKKALKLHIDMTLQEFINNVKYSLSITNDSYDGIFKNASAVYFKNVELPDEVVFNVEGNIYDRKTFSYFPKIKTIKVGAGNLEFGSCPDVEKVVFLKEATGIKTNMFTQCPKLKEVTFENPIQIKSIGQKAFYRCNSLTYFEIPSEITAIGMATFDMGSSSDKVTYVFKSTIPPTIQTNTFTTSKINKIFVPLGSASTYKSATNWSSLASYIFEPNNVTISVPSELLNNENYVYAIDNSDEYNQFTSTSLSLENVARIKIKSLTVDTTILVGTTSGGNDIGTISNSELNHITEGNQTIYLTIQ